MKHPIMFALVMLLPGFFYGQTVLLQESFETDGEGSRYVSNSGDDPALSDIWQRTSSLPHPYHGTTIGTGSLDGSFYWAAEDVFSLLGGADAVMTLNALTVTSYNNLEVQIALGLSRFGQTRWENDDYLFIEYNMDGGGWNIIGYFRGDNVSSGIGGLTQVDTDNDPGTFGPFGGQMPGTFTDYTFSIPATGNSLQVRVRTNVNGTEEFGFDNLRIRGDVVVPVDLLDFSAHVVQQSTILSWSSAMELNHDGYIIERVKQTGSGIDEAVEVMGFVAGKGNTNELSNYRFTIPHQAPGQYAYRLKQLDLDGSFAYSQWVELTIEAELAREIFPNPVRDQVWIGGERVSSLPITISISDFLGRVVLEKQFMGETHPMMLDVSGLPAGKYLLQMRSRGRVSQKPLLKVE